MEDLAGVSLHDAIPIWKLSGDRRGGGVPVGTGEAGDLVGGVGGGVTLELSGDGVVDRAVAAEDDDPLGCQDGQYLLGGGRDSGGANQHHEGVVASGQSG